MVTSHDPIPFAEPRLGGNERRYLEECLETNWISSRGPFLGRFEAGLARLCGTRHAIATSSGTAALHLALSGLGIGPGDEVVVPTLTFAATANAVLMTGARPVPVDVDPRTWTLDPERAEAAVTPRTRALVPVHLFGHPADMDPLVELARRRGIALVEDAAQAHGARYRDRPVGRIGKVGCFSFYGNKIVTTGQGGACVTDDDALADRLRVSRAHGMDAEHPYWHEAIGFNYQMTNLQAAVGTAQLEQLDEVLALRDRIREAYQERLAVVDGLQTLPRADWARPVCWMVAVLLPPGTSPPAVRDALAEQAIDARPIFSPLHGMPPYRRPVHCPVAEDVAARGLVLPTFAHLTENQLDRICDVVIGAIEPVRRVAGRDHG